MTTTRNYTALIAALLAKANGTDNEAEAAIYLSKASALQLEHMIEDSDLRQAQNEAGARADEVISHTVRGLPKGAGYIKAKRDLLYGLARTFHCQVTIKADRSEVQIYGFQSDVDFVQTLFDSLLIQLMRHMEQDAKQARLGRGAGIDRSWRTSYAHGWAIRVEQRLSVSRRVQEAEADTSTPGTSLMLRDRSVAVQAYVDDLFAGRKLGASYRNRSVRSLAGLNAGTQAGDRADLGGTAVGGTRKQLG